jgi:dTDP-4-amino-4,6-dideoxygalactose transaminase
VRYKVPFIKPHFPSSAEIADDYNEIVESNWFTNFGKFEVKFRSEIENYIGDNVFACTAANATLALDVAILHFLKKGRATKVITQSFTFSAASIRLTANGYTPVFIDIDTKLQPDISQARAYLKEYHDEVSGILICNTFGVGNPQIEDWEVLAKKYNVPLIIDSAAGFGSEYYEGEKIGSRGDCEVFSFHATKPLSIGEGGAITSKNQKDIEGMRSLTNFGFDTDHHITAIGTNAKLQEISSAIGCRQINDFDARLAKRRNILEVYKSHLTDLNYSFQANDNISSVPFATVISQDSSQASKLISKLNKAGIGARDYYRPLHYQQKLTHMFEVAGSLDYTEEVASKVVSLPVHDDMDDKDMDFIIKQFQ